MHFTPTLYLSFFIFFPVIVISGSFLVIQEVVLYAFVLLSILSGRKLRIPNFSEPLLWYIVLFGAMVSIISITTQSSINAEELYVFRSAVQFFIALIFFDNCVDFDIISKKSILTFCFILSLPSLTVALQITDIWGARDLIRTLYQPVYGYLDYEFLSSFRSTAVFKDYFTASIYFIIIELYLFFCLLKVNLSPLAKSLIIAFISLIYASMFFVGRTGLAFTPIVLILVYIAEKGIYRTLGNWHKIAIIASIFLVVMLFAYQRYGDELDWAFEMFKLFDAKATGDFSSVQDMSQMNKGFIEYIKTNPSILVSPKHVYDLSYTNNYFYTDNFYLQEIYRYGVYGLALFVIFAIVFFCKLRSNIAKLLILLLVMLNYKGGNTFFMAKNVYIYSFLIVFLEKFSQRKDVSK